MESEVTKSVTPGNVGKEMANLPKKTASVLLSYKFTPKFTFGGTLTHQSSKFSGSPGTMAEPQRNAII
jgi:outer membrane receptor protein involved in Fe transport